MPVWLWGAAFIAVLLVIVWMADWHAKRHYRRPAGTQLIRVRSGPAAGGPASPRASS